MLANITLFVDHQTFCRTWEESLLIIFLSDWPVPELVAIKVESCLKSRRILDVFFARPNVRRRAFQKLDPRWLTLSPLSFDTSPGKFRENIPISPEVIGAHMLNFKPNFKFSQLKVFGGPRPLWVLAIKPWSISSVLKNWEGNTPKGRNVVSTKKSTWVARF